MTLNRSMAALFATLLLSACGGGGGDGDSPDTSTDPINSTNTGSDTGADTDSDTDTGSGAGTGNPDPATPGPSGATPVEMDSPLELSALPNPPITENPSADDEPLPQAPELNTITSFQVVREPAPRVPFKLPEEEFTEEDFAAGLPEAVVTVPADVDPTTNAPPFFEGLENVRVNAGEIVEIRYIPRDPEGELPGMFAQELPEGATFDDNFDGTRTLIWQTFQADIGITEFTVVAIDPANSLYRSSQTLLIAVDESEDPSNEPNIAPTIEPVTSYTVRVGDPAVVLIDGFDRNGTTPTVELLNPPSTATLTPDERDPDLQWLQVIPDEVGTVTIDVLTRDEIDPELTGLDQITLFVRPASDFERSGARLKDAASGSGVLFGSAISPVFYLQGDGGVYESVAATEYSIITPESSMKWDAMNPLPGAFTFADMDNLMRFAEVNSLSVRGHPLVWHRSLPSWVEATNPDDREVHMREFITRVMSRYRDGIDFWDVVNEPLNDADGNIRQSIWYEAMGESYIDTAFIQARELDPNAVLVLNEFDIGFAGPKFDGLVGLIDRLQSRSVPVDAIGFQMHVFASYDQFDELAANMAAIAERGLDIHVTELDVAMVDGSTNAQQAAVYAGVIETCRAQPRCTVLQTWGFTDRYSFRTFLDPLYFDRSYQTKEAYGAMQDALSGN